MGSSRPWEENWQFSCDANDGDQSRADDEMARRDDAVNNRSN